MLCSSSVPHEYNGHVCPLQLLSGSLGIRAIRRLLADDHRDTVFFYETLLAHDAHITKIFYANLHHLM